MSQSYELEVGADVNEVPTKSPLEDSVSRDLAMLLTLVVAIVLVVTTAAAL